MTHAVRPQAMALAIFSVILFLPLLALAEDDSRALWRTSAEVGIGPIEEDVFLHLTPRLSFMHPVPIPEQFCDDGGCQTLFEASFQVPLRLRIVDREPTQDGVLRSEDWQDVSDYFRIIRRLEYGSFEDPIHVRAGELGPTNFGHGTIVNGYYNVITTDHYRLGVQGRVEQPQWGAEFMVNDLTAPNLFGFRAIARPEALYDEDHDLRRITLGATAVVDSNAPTRLVGGDNDNPAVAGPDLRPVVETARPTTIVGVDAQWNALRGQHWALTPYTDLNHHSGLGSGLHTGIMWDQNFGEFLRLSSKFEYRLMAGRYLPDYIDPLYEITRFQHPSFDEPGVAGPKLTAAASMEPETRHGGLGQVQARFAQYLHFSAAYADGTGPTGANLRLRASVDYENRAMVGLFYYKAVHGDQRFTSTMRELADLDGALAALEGRFTIWGPFYGLGQFGRQWRLRDDGQFENVHLFMVGAGAGTTF